MAEVKIFPDNLDPIVGQLYRCGNYAYHWRRWEDPDEEVELIYVRRKEVPGMTREEWLEEELLCMDCAAKRLTEAGDLWEVSPESIKDWDD